MPLGPKHTSRRTKKPHRRVGEAWECIILHEGMLRRPEYQKLHAEFEKRIGRLNMREAYLHGEMCMGNEESLPRTLLQDWLFLRFVGGESLGKGKLLARIDAHEVVASREFGFGDVDDVRCAIMGLHLSGLVDVYDVSRGSSTGTWRLTPWSKTKLARKAKSIVAKRDQERMFKVAKPGEPQIRRRVKTTDC